MISIIVPVLDEEAAIGPALARLKDHEPGEIIVVDGGSRDRTTEIARAAGVRVEVAAGGRGSQMNRGALQAAGDRLLFLHVDTVLPFGALPAIDRALANAGVVGGGFRKAYDADLWFLRLVSAVLNHVRSGWFHSLVGTQAIFVRRVVFDSMNGFQEWPLLEDVDFSDRLRRRGRVALLDAEVVVSSRRYRQRGVLRQVFVNCLVLLLFRLGVTPQRLQRTYQGRR